MRRPNRPTRCQSRPEALELRCCLSTVTAHGSEHAETGDGAVGEVSGGIVGGAGEESAAETEAETGAEARVETGHPTLGSVRFSIAQADGSELLQIELGAEFHAVLWQNALGESLTPSGHAQWRLAIPPGSQRLALTAQDLNGGRWTWQVDVSATGVMLGVAFAAVDNVEGGFVQDGVPAALNGLDHAHADLASPLVAEQLRQITRSHSPHDSWFANTDWATTVDMTSVGHGFSVSHNLPLTLASSGLAHDRVAAHGNSPDTTGDAEHFAEGEFAASELAGEGPMAGSPDALGNGANSAQLPLDYWNLPYPLELHPETLSHPASEDTHDDELWEEEAWVESLAATQGWGAATNKVELARAEFHGHERVALSGQVTAAGVDAWAASDEPWESDEPWDNDELLPPRDHSRVAHTSTTAVTSSFVTGETDGDVDAGLSRAEQASTISVPGLVAAGSFLLAIQLECWAETWRRRTRVSLAEEPSSTADPRDGDDPGIAAPRDGALREGCWKD